MALSQKVGNRRELTEAEKKWPLPHERKLLDLWKEAKDSSEKTMTSDAARRKVVLERLHAYNDTLSGVQKWRGLADQTDKQLKNKIEALMKKGKIENKKRCED